MVNESDARDPETAQPPAGPARQEVSPEEKTPPLPAWLNRLRHNLWLTLALLGILLVGAAFRLTELEVHRETEEEPFSPQAGPVLSTQLWRGGPILTFRSWDEDLHLHPDERFLTYVEQDISFPETCRPFVPDLRFELPEESPWIAPFFGFWGRIGDYVRGARQEGALGDCLRDYLDSAQSPLNPRNRGHGLFVYGYLPIFTVRIIIESIGVQGLSLIPLAGRVLSAMADLTAIVLTFFLGKRLYGSRAGLLAAGLLSLSVLNIQNSHFFTVDTFTATMTLLGVYLAVVIAEGKGRWGTFVLTGLVFGGMVSSKINVASFALILGLAGAVRVWRQVREKGDEILWPAIWRTAAALAVVVLLAVGVFRLAQPYAFYGTTPPEMRPSIPEVSSFLDNYRLSFLEKYFDPRFLENMGTVQGLVSGEIDYPPSHQWTNRTALWFPWKNMVLWGMGLPLGLAAWAGVVLAGWQLLRKRDLRHIVPLSWTLFLFIYQGVQFVKTMRYFLPLYPLLCVFAAHLLLWLWDRARQKELRPRWRTVGAGALLTIVVGGTFLWAWAFIQIYRRPMSRATASRWIYENYPTDQGAWLLLNDGTELPISIPNAFTYKAGAAGSMTPFTPPRDVLIAGLTINHLEDLTQSEGIESLEVVITADQAGEEILAQGVVVGDFHGPAGDGAPGIARLDTIPLQGGRTYYLRLRGLQGSVRTWATAIANEAWDDALPMRVDGKDGFTTYRGIDLQPYAEDTPAKVNDLLHQLANADLVVLSSNRLYASIPRLPMRYPATTRYYEALFDGTLGFEHMATFTSYPTLFGWEIPDDSAEEAFSIYDHPKVLLFARTESFDLERARALLTEGIDWDNIARIRPIEVPSHRDLLLTEQEKDVQQEGGTWSEIFQRDSWTNRLSVLVWLLLVELLGLAAFPLAHFLLGRLTDGGYLPAKMLGILLLGFFSWLPAATKVLPFTRGTIALALGLIVLLGGVVGWFRRKELLALVKARRRLLLLEEGIFLAGFLIFLLIRMGNPDLWHPWYGGEKPMDLAYLTAVTRSTTFPPYDPWFSGGYLNYYYYGQVLIAALIKLTGIVPSVAYNLALPLFYGLACGGVFTVVYHLVHRGREEGDGWDRRAIVSGLAGAAFVALLGNLGEYFVLVGKLVEKSQSSFVSSIPGLSSLVKGADGLVKAMRDGIPFDTGSWYWDASRVMGHGEINEFPFFTFLYADLHPHLIALPSTLLILTQIVAWVRDRRPRGESFWSLLPPPWTVLGMGLILGALRCGHFFDFPTYTLLAVAGWAVALYQRRQRADWKTVAGVALLAPLLLLLSSWLYRPFWSRYASYYNKLLPWTGERTRVGAYLVINGLFLFVILSYLLVKTLGRGTREGPLRLLGTILRFWDRLPTLTRRMSRWVRRPTALQVLSWGCLILLIVSLFFHLPVASSPEQGDPAAQPSLITRLRGQPLLGWLVIPALLGAVLLFRRGAQGEDRLIALIVLTGLGISAGVELWVFRGDIGRMNMVFRFYLQLWVLWGIASAAMLPFLWARFLSWTSGARKRWKVVFFLLVSLCTLYPLLATQAKIKDRFPDTNLGPGLDGAAYMQQAVYGDAEGGPIVLAKDAGAIRWLQDNVAGSPVILEGHTPQYRWGSRISVYTGLPSVIGWGWHQIQQKAALQLPVVDRRVNDVSTLYGGTDVAQTLSLLRKYEVSYIVVGQLERYYYPEEGLAKFERMVGVYLEQVYPAVPLATGSGESPLTAPELQPYAPSQQGPYPYGPGETGADTDLQAPLVTTTGTVIYRVLPAVLEP